MPESNRLTVRHPDLASLTRTELRDYPEHIIAHGCSINVTNDQLVGTRRLMRYGFTTDDVSSLESRQPLHPYAPNNREGFSGAETRVTEEICRHMYQTPKLFSLPMLAEELKCEFRPLEEYLLKKEDEETRETERKILTERAKEFTPQLGFLGSGEGSDLMLLEDAKRGAGQGDTVQVPDLSSGLLEGTVEEQESMTEKQTSLFEVSETERSEREILERGTTERETSGREVYETDTYEMETYEMETYETESSITKTEPLFSPSRDPAKRNPQAENIPASHPRSFDGIVSKNEPRWENENNPSPSRPPPEHRRRGDRQARSISPKKPVRVENTALGRNISILEEAARLAGMQEYSAHARMQRENLEFVLEKHPAIAFDEEDEDEDAEWDEDVWNVSRAKALRDEIPVVARESIYDDTRKTEARTLEELHYLPRRESPEPEFQRKGFERIALWNEIRQGKDITKAKAKAKKCAGQETLRDEARVEEQAQERRGVGDLAPEHRVQGLGHGPGDGLVGQEGEHEEPIQETPVREERVREERVQDKPALKAQVEEEHGPGEQPHRKPGDGLQKRHYHEHALQPSQADHLPEESSLSHLSHRVTSPVPSDLEDNLTPHDLADTISWSSTSEIFFIPHIAPPPLSNPLPSAAQLREEDYLTYPSTVEMIPGKESVKSN
jgi:hypothetical protein